MNTTMQVEPEESSTNEGTYYDAKRLLRVCSACEILSWFALLLGGFSLVVWVWYLFSSLTTTHYPSLSAFLGNAAPLVIVIGMAALICFFFWAFLRAISEGLYLLMDIQEGQKGEAAT